MHRDYACNSPEHSLTRRRFLTGTLGMLGFGGLVAPAAAKELAKAQKRVLLIWLSGGSSQLETWDPKPGTDTGGPFQTIGTSVPGIHICETLPFSARQMHRLAVVRGINTAEDDHGKGAVIMHTGRRPDPAVDYPQLGAAAAKLLGSDDNPLPGHVVIRPGGGSGSNKQDSGFLGPKYASVTLADGK